LVELTQIGTSLKAHGKDGQLRVYVEDAFLDDLEKARALFLNIDGSRIPFIIQGIEIKNHMLIKLDEIDNPEMASKLSNKEMYLDSSKVSEESLSESKESSMDRLIGFSVYDQDDNNVGKITSVIENEFQTLLNIENLNSSFLWPIHDDLIIGIDDSESIIKLLILEGFDS